MKKLHSIIVKLLTNIDGGQPFSKYLRKYYLKFYDIDIGYGSYGGCFDINRIPRGTKFGNYCSVAEGVTIFRANHPLNKFTTHPIFYNPIFGYVNSDKLERPKISIGHDVWLGYNSVILPTVEKIGNGSVVGAGSVVTKDVEPYSIVAGNPARHIRFRFNQKTILELEKSKWFNFEKKELIKKENYINKIISDFK